MTMLTSAYFETVEAPQILATVDEEYQLRVAAVLQDVLADGLLHPVAVCRKAVTKALGPTDDDLVKAVALTYLKVERHNDGGHWRDRRVPLCPEYAAFLDASQTAAERAGAYFLTISKRDTPCDCCEGEIMAGCEQVFCWETKEHYHRECAQQQGIDYHFAPKWAETQEAARMPPEVVAILLQNLCACGSGQPRSKTRGKCTRCTQQEAKAAREAQRRAT